MDYVTAAIQGSSFYKLPRVLQWFTATSDSITSIT